MFGYTNVLEKFLTKDGEHDEQILDRIYGQKIT